jgi:hypothetical protein
MPSWQTKKVLIVVKTYPTPALDGVEVSCTAGITEQGEWVRLFPIPYRFLAFDKRFRRYQWVKVATLRSSDARPESYKINPTSIELLGKPLDTKRNWQARKDVVFPLLGHCLCCIKARRDKEGFPTLGIFKPATIEGLVIEPTSDAWTPAEQAKLDQANQGALFGKNIVPREQLEKVPFKFKYRFRCDEAGCNGHTLSCTDWEMHQAWRDWSRKYGADWESKFRQKFEAEMRAKDAYFYVGTIHRHPENWIIIGLFYPPR